MPGADRDRADAHVTKKDVPTLVRCFEIAATGKGGHGPLKRDRSGQAIKWRCTFLNTPPKFLLPASDNVGSSVKHRTDISGLHDLIFGGCLKR